MHTYSACVSGALRVCILPVTHHTCATGIFVLVACYPQRTVYALRVAILGALRVSFFLVVYVPLVLSKQCMHALYPLFDCPEILLRAGQSLMVTNNNAHRSNGSCCAHPTPLHLVLPTTAKIHRLMALGTHQCRCRVASVLG
jgi:hypothetical protein